MGHGGGTCLVCGSSGIQRKRRTPTSFDSILPTLSDQLEVYFILKHVLQLPSELLEKYLRSCPSPEECLRVCEPCNENYLEKCRNIFVELLEVKRKFVEAGLDVVKAIRESSQANIQLELEDEDDKPKRRKERKQSLVLDICNEISQFVIQRDDCDTYNINPFICGDLLARDKLLEEGARITREIRRTPKSQIPSTNDETWSDLLAVAVCPELDLIDQGIKPEPSSPLASDSVSVDSWHPNEEEDDLTADEGPPLCSSKPKKRRGRPLARNPQENNKKRNKYRCSICNKAYLHHGSFQTHMGNLHGVNKEKLKYPCRILNCDLSFFSKNQRCHHEARHTDTDKKQLKCKICGKVFLQRTSLTIHMNGLHGNLERSKMSCPLCPAKYKLKSFLSTHMKDEHDGVTEERKLFPCQECGKLMISEQKLRRHIETKHRNGSKICCHVCGKMISLTHKNPHMARIHQIFPPGYKLHKFPCNVEGCGKQFATSSKLKRHVAIVHEKVRPLQCEQCGNNFATPHGLKQHITAVHSENRETRPFKCELCGDGFAVKEYLRGHMKTHKKGK